MSDERSGELERAERTRGEASAKDVQPVVVYTVAVREPAQQLLDVAVRVRQPAGGATQYAFAVWTPGSYLVREYEQFAQDFAAQGPGGPLPIRQLDKRTWRIDHEEGIDWVELRYRVFAGELSVRTNHLDASHALVVPAATFVEVDGCSSRPVEVCVEAPPDWRVYTPLRAVDGDERRFVADDFDALIDSFLEMGPRHAATSFEVGGREHRFVIWGRGNWDLERIAQDTAAIARKASELFDGDVPFDRYLFALLCARGAHGGLEHHDGCVLGWDALGFRQRRQYEDFLRLVAHEYFHAWNVKVIRPRSFARFDYGREAYTHMLWLHEGGTVYYEGLLTVRAGVVRTATWFDALASDLLRLERTPGRHHDSLASASFNAWTRLYRAYAHTPNATVSYYLKGQFAALCFDWEIRRASQGRCSLDDVLRALYRQCRREGGYDEDAFVRIVREATGVDIARVYAAWVESPGELPVERALRWYGLELERTHKDDTAERPWLGIRTRTRDGRLYVEGVFEHSPAHRAGLQPGDELAALAGWQVRPDTLDRVLDGLTPGDTVTATVFRREQLAHLSVELASAPPDRYILRRSADATAEEAARFEAWTGRALPARVES